MNPYYEQDGITIYHADCRDVLPTLAPNSVDLVLTDPPYGLEMATWDRTVPYGMLTDFLRLSRGPVLWFGSASKVPESYASFPVTPHRMLVWYVTFTLARTCANGIYYRWHPIYCWNLPKERKRGEVSHPNQDVLSFGQDGHNPWHHPGTKPLALMRELVCIVPGNALILDPFLGSGTTLVAAKQLNRRAIGIEIEERYCEIAANRLAQTVMQLEAPASNGLA